MKQLIFLVTLLTCACLKIQAQVNYVLNPSFEQHSKCPYILDQIKYATDWSPIDSIGSPDSVFYLPPCVPDYCNTCDTAPFVPGNDFAVNIPRNDYFYQYPRTGNGMVQVRMLVDATMPGADIDFRDYLQGRLYKPLTAGKDYCVTFYVNLAEASGYAIGKIGAYLDDGSIDVGQDSASCSKPQTAYSPQIVASSIINDTMNWVQVRGLFTASGTEKFITIGNFSDFAHTDKIAVNYSGYSSQGFSFYLIDDVSVVEVGTKPIAGPDMYVSPGSDSATIGSSEEGLPLTWVVLGSAVPIGHTGSLKVHPDTTTTYVLFLDICDVGGTDTVTVWVAPAGVTSPGLSKGEVKLLPNPARDVLNIEGAAGCEVSVFNLLGQRIYSASIISNNEVINIKDLVQGIYTMQITEPSTGARLVRKLVKQ